MSVRDISEAMDIAVKSSAPSWSFDNQLAQHWGHCPLQMLQFQQICKLRCEIANLEASTLSSKRQMQDLRDENAVLQSQLSITECREEAARHDGDAFSAFPSPPPGLLRAGLDADIDWAEIKNCKTEAAPAADVISTRVSSTGGRPSIVVQWRIHCFSTQLAEARGKSLVSPLFDVGSLSGLRLMVAAKVQGALAPSGRHARQAHRKLVTQGPLDGCLMLKVPKAPNMTLIYNVLIGDDRTVSFANNFSDHCVATHSHLGIDFLQARGDDGSLLVGIEILEPDSCSER